MHSKPDIHRLIEFQQFMLSFQSIKRKSYIPGTNRLLENDVEHSYFLAMAAWYLAPYFPHLDADKMLRLALAHDLIEVHAGDTFVYGDKAAIETKPVREQQALTQLEQEWPDFPAVTEHIREYAERSSEEAKFVYTLDKLLPPMINYLAGGATWQEFGVTIADFQREKERKIPQDAELYPYYQEILAFFQQQPDLFAKEKKTI